MTLFFVHFQFTIFISSKYKKIEQFSIEIKKLLKADQINPEIR